MYVTQAQSERIQKLGRDLERRTGVEFVAAVVGKCDTYPEIPWKAFAMGAVVGAMACFIYAVLYPQGGWQWGPWIPLSSVLGAAAAAALLTPWWSGFARLFLDQDRAETEAHQYAQGLFLEHALFQTEDRRAVIMVIGLFEHRIVILPDSGVQEGFSQVRLEEIIGRMTPHLRKGRHYEALVEGIRLLEEELVATGFEPQGTTGNRIDDALIQREGER